MKKKRKKVVRKPLTRRRAKSQNHSWHAIHLHRKSVDWTAFQNNGSKRLWMCGTSLRSVTERDLLASYQKKRARDIRILLPDWDPEHSSFIQLTEFNETPNQRLPDQLGEAEDCHGRIAGYLISLFGMHEKYLRKHPGIMYANITIMDEDALIAFYDATGIGELNFTLHVKKSTNRDAYYKIEEDFLRMWNAS